MDLPGGQVVAVEDGAGAAPSREVVKQLTAAGFTKRDGKGSHTTCTCAHGLYSVSAPTGHRTISPGVRHRVNAAVRKCATTCKEA